MLVIAVALIIFLRKAQDSVFHSDALILALHQNSCAMTIHHFVWSTGFIVLIYFLVEWFKGRRRDRDLKRKLAATKRVFVSYDHSEDRHHLDQFRDWIKNREFDFAVELRSPVKAINSEEERRIKAALTTKMKQADYLLVIVGEKSHESRWMEWEIRKAKELDMNLKLVAVKINNRYKTPPDLLNSGTQFARSFNKRRIKEAMEKAIKEDYRRIMAQSN